jgi:peptidoglycan/LPS O-acetylase OafA/YrhL
MGLYHYVHNNVKYNISDWFILIGACIFVIIALSSQNLIKFLLTKPVRFFGKISYSMYLYHLPILMSLLFLLSKKINIIAIYIIAFLLILIVSTLSWYFVENKCISLGKTLTKMYREQKIEINEIKLKN